KREQAPRTPNAGANIIHPCAGPRAKRLECVRLAGAFALLKRSIYPLKVPAPTPTSACMTPLLSRRVRISVRLSIPHKRTLHEPERGCVVLDQPQRPSPA